MFLQELFAGLGAVDLRRMFDFDALFCGDTIFGVVIDERVFLKTDNKSRDMFLAEGSGSFTYATRNGREIVTSYYELPARLFEQPEEAAIWARKAYEIALHSPTTAPKQRARTTLKTPRQPARRTKRS